jgi:glycosyltransferase involved in cell wall biosynthesis
MNILIITQYFWPENFRINDLAVSLKEKGHRITVLTGIPNYPQGRFFDGYNLLNSRFDEYCGIRVIRAPLIPRGKSKGWQLAINFISFALSASLIAPFIRHQKYDAIFVFEVSPITVGIPAIVLKKIKNIPIFFWVLDLWPESISSAGKLNSPMLLKCIGLLVRFIYRYCDRILISSQGFRPNVEAMGGRSDKIDYFPNWCETAFESIKDNCEPSQNIVLPVGFRIMFAGNVGEAQSFMTILKAAEILKDYPDIHWLVLGDGRMFEYIKEEIKKRGLSNTVHLLGRHPLESMPHFFAQADVMLVSLKRDPIFSLTIPGKIQSYMICGKPIIASLDGEGARLIQASGAGLTSPAEDAECLAKSALSIYNLPKSKREEIGRLGKKYCELKFRRETLIDSLEKLMEEEIHNKRHKDLC